MNITKIVFGLIFLFSSSLLFAQDAEEIIIPLSNATQRGELRVDMHRGIINVKGTNRKDVSVKYTSPEKKVARIEDAGNGLKRLNSNGVDIEISESSNIVRVSPGHKQNVNLIIEVPLNFDLRIQTHHDGDVTLENVKGEIEVEAHHGEISATAISGSLVANSWHGDITVTFNQVTPDAPMAFTTYHGKVDVTLPANTKANLKLKSDQGEVLTGFDVKLQEKAPVVKDDGNGSGYKVSIDNWIIGTINGGGAEIIAKNHNGDVLIRKGN